MMFLKKSKKTNMVDVALHSSDFLTRKLTTEIADEFNLSIPYEAKFGSSEDIHLQQIYRIVAERTQSNKDFKYLFSNFVTDDKFELMKSETENQHWRLSIAEKRFHNAAAVTASKDDDSVWSRWSQLRNFRIHKNEQIATKLTPFEEELFKNPGTDKYGRLFKNKTEVTNYITYLRYAFMDTGYLKSPNRFSDSYGVYLAEFHRLAVKNKTVPLLPDITFNQKLKDALKIISLIPEKVLTAGHTSALVRIVNSFTLEEIQHMVDHKVNFTLITRMLDSMNWDTTQDLLEAVDTVPLTYLAKMFKVKLDDPMLIDYMALLR